MAQIPAAEQPPAWLTQQEEHATRYNHRRDPAFMEDEHVPNTSTAGMPTAAETRANAGVPPIAIPYMALQNLDRSDGTGKRIIVPMVAGFESTFLANTLQGLLCLPGCESVFMGEPRLPAGSKYAMTGGPLRDHKQDEQSNSNEEDPVGLALEDADNGRSSRSSSSTGSAASSPSPVSTSPTPETATARVTAIAATGGERGSNEATARSHASSHSASSVASDTNSLGPSGELDVMAGDESGTSAGHRHASGEDCGDDGTASARHRHHRDGKSHPVLRGGIRCHWNTRVKTAVSRTYADFVLQHLEDGEIQLQAPPLRGASASAVTDVQLDEAGELETLRGQTPNVPRCLAAVALPEERQSLLAGVTQLMQRLTKESAAVTYTSSHTSPLRHVSARGAAITVAEPANTSTTTAEKLLPTTSEHSCSDNSPTPSSGDNDDVRSTDEQEATNAGGTDEHATESLHHRRHTSSPLAAASDGETRVGGMHAVAHDLRRYTCFASNSVENMPVYHFPKLRSADLTELAAFMVVRSSVQPDEAVDLDLGSRILGSPSAMAQMNAEQRAALVHRAARLLESAVFLQL